MKKEEIKKTFFSEELVRCESHLKQSESYYNFSKESSSENTRCYKILASIYLLQSDIEHANLMFSHLSQLGGCNKNDRLDIIGLPEKDKTDPYLLSDIGAGDAEDGVILYFSRNPQKSQLFFEWAAESCRIAEKQFREDFKEKRYDYHSRVCLWLGYALICPGQYSEAVEYIRNVVPFCEKWKKITGEVYWRIEFALPKALVPLCEFKLKPTRQNLINTQKGIEDYIKSLREPRFKLDGYLYYFHLKEQFADIYSADPKDYPEELPVPAKETTKKIRASKSGEPQNVWIWDVVSIVVGEEFGTDEDLKTYVQYVTNLGGYPVLSSLMDIYLLWDEVDARELADECGRLLAMDDLDPEVRKKTDIIRQLADYSAAKGSGRLVLKPEDGV